MYNQNRDYCYQKEAEDTSKLPKHIIKDGAKWLMMPTKIIMDSLSIWPERQDNYTRILHFMCIFSFVFCLIGLIYYIADKESNLGSSAFAISVIIVTIATTLRRLLCYFYRKELTNVLHVLYFEFWPSDIAGNALHKDIYRQSVFLLIYFVLNIIMAFIWGTQAIIIPIFNGNLPLSTKYPFSWWKSPYYGILYVWQAFLSIELTSAICGVDFFFASLLLNCVAQFKLLRRFLRQNFKKAIQNSYLSGDGNCSQTPMQVILVCIKHHNDIIRTCKEIESIFSFFILLQYLASIGAVCLSGFVATYVPQELSKAITYCTGHIWEIFIYCYMGENLIIESTKLSNAIFECGWHLSVANKELQKSLIMIMVRSQKAIRISAGGFGYLSLSSFVRLIQFSFSVYTLLNKMMRKQKDS